jgi:hypothetical protein
MASGKRLRGLQPLPAWQGETVVRGLRRLFPRQKKSKCAQCKAR